MTRPASKPIGPTGIIRRRGTKKWHIVRDQAAEHYGTMCGQHIRMPEESVAYDASEITCTDCIIAAIRKA